MNKQDRPRARTPADIEQKYNFGKTFAEVFDLITDAQKAAEEAQKAIDSLDHEQIFNLLTDNGRIQGVYRGDDGNVYINATYIKSGKLAAEFIDADNLNVKAANITGAITFNQLDDDVSEKLNIKAGNITGTITHSQLNPDVSEKLSVRAANLSGSIAYNQLSADLQEQISNVVELPDYIKETYIDAASIQSPTITGGTIAGGALIGGTITGAEIYGGIFSNLESENFLRMRSDNDFGNPDDWSMLHVLEHFVGDVDHNVAITQMGYVAMHNDIAEVSSWVLMVMGNMLLYKDTSTGTTRAFGKWDFSGATVTGL